MPSPNSPLRGGRPPCRTRLAFGWSGPGGFPQPVARLTLGQGGPASVHHFPQHGRADHFQGQLEFAAGDHHGAGPGHVAAGNAPHQVGEVVAAAVAEMDDQEGFVGRGHVPGDEGVGGVHQGHALDVDVGEAELGNDVVDVVIHATQDGFHGFRRVAVALGAVPMDLLDPFQVDGGHHADHEIHVPGYIDALAADAAVDLGGEVARVHLAPGPGFRHQAAVLALVEQDVAGGGHGPPGREFARGHAQGLAAGLVMGVFPQYAAAGFRVGLEKRLQFGKKIAFRSEPGNAAAAAPRLLQQGGELAIREAPEGVAVDDGGLDVLPFEDVLEGVAHGGQTRAGHARDGDDGMPG
jgi:hypothetical protein